MARIIVTAQVEDAAKWEEAFRTRGELFREQTVRAVHFTVGDDNEAALVFECDNLDKYLEILNSEVTEEAMKVDGVKRETVKIFVLDKEFRP